MKSITKGLIAGSILGATMSMLAESRMDNRTRRKMMKRGSYLARKTCNILGNIYDVFR